MAVIATSLGGGNVYVRRRMADVRLGLLLALATAPSAIIGALLATQVNARLLAAMLAAVLAASAYGMLNPHAQTDPDQTKTEVDSQPSSLHLQTTYQEPSTGETVTYRVTRIPMGVCASVLAGLMSGLLGVGGGIVQVPVMHTLMRVPIKVATATSTYVIGITAVAGAFVYYNHRPSYVDPSLTIPVTIGVFLGASVGSRILGRVSQRGLRSIFTAVLVIYSIQMTLRIFGIGGG